MFHLSVFCIIFFILWFFFFNASYHLCVPWGANTVIEDIVFIDIRLKVFSATINFNYMMQYISVVDCSFRVFVIIFVLVLMYEYLQFLHCTARLLFRAEHLFNNDTFLSVSELLVLFFRYLLLAVHSLED